MITNDERFAIKTVYHIIESKPFVIRYHSSLFLDQCVTTCQEICCVLRGARTSTSMPVCPTCLNKFLVVFGGVENATKDDILVKTGWTYRHRRRSIHRNQIPFAINSTAIISPSLLGQAKKGLSILLIANGIWFRW